MTKFKNLFAMMIVLSSFFCGLAQEIKYFNAPEFYQFYARDKSDSATVSVHGEIDKGKKYDAIELKVFKDNQLYNTQESSIQEKQFQIDARIDAGLHQYRFELHFRKGESKSMHVIADSVVCGDAYIITGQSNSHPSSSLSTYSSPYCRSFGVKTGYEPYSDEDKKVRWGRASGNCPGLKGVGGWFTKNPYGVGVWGMELARLIVEKHKVPVCIINGGSGSSSIEENMLYPERPSLETSFGCLAYRVNQAGLKDNVKAVFWHQGETNSDERYKTYAKKFDALLKDWNRVYAGLKKIYLFQLHPGCGGNYQSELREVQRQLAKRYKMVEIMSTTGVFGHDGCHFSYEGYCEFAHRIFPLVSRDFYGEKPKSIITPPKLLNAYYRSSDKIVLEFDQAIKVDEKYKVNGSEYYMKDQFFFRQKENAPVTAEVVKGIEVLQENMVLIMNDETSYETITWLPNKNYVGSHVCYQGPWIRGSKNDIGALSFDRKTINNPSGFQDESKSNWYGYSMLDSTLNGIPFKLVYPKTANKKRNWIWRARFWGHEPQTDLALLDLGFHVAYIEVGGLFGAPKALQIWDSFYAFVVEKYHLNEKVVLEGMSRGGLPIFNWGNRNAEKVACIYGDAPVCDFKSWPGGYGDSPGSLSDWKACLAQYGLTEEEAVHFDDNPIDRVENIAGQKVPILNVIGDADKVVPVSENTGVLKKRLKDLGAEIKIIHKPNVGHHPHSLKDPKPIVDFILMNTGNIDKKVAPEPLWSMNNVTLRSGFENCTIQFERSKIGHVAFIGGSITEMEGYRPMLWNYLEEKFPETDFSFTNAGISSTCSTTGAFRLERDVLSKGPVDLLFIEFAVNDEQDAGHTYNEALLGMEGIIRNAIKHNPNVDIIITYFVNPEILNDYQQGKIRTSIKADEAVAKHYNISTCNLAKEVADQITVGTLDWETYGGVHPSDYGNSICAGMIASMLDNGWNVKNSIGNPEPLSVFSYENGKLVSPVNCHYDKKWSYGVPDWKNIVGQKRDRFTNSKLLSTAQKSAELSFEFEGTAIGAYILAGPDAGIVEVSIDGGEYKEFDLYHRFSKGLHYPRTVVFSNDLKKGKHTMKLRMLKKTKSVGKAMRLMNFVVN